MLKDVYHIFIMAKKLERSYVSNNRELLTKITLTVVKPLNIINLKRKNSHDIKLSKEG